MFASSGFLINKNCTIAVHIAPIAKPIKASFEPLTSYFEIKNDKNKLTAKAPKNEPIGNTNNGAVGKIIIIITAAKLAPLEIPITSGEANGFLITACIIAPHIARQLIGNKTLHVIIMSGLIGAILLTFGDGLARGIHPPLDIPVGVIIAIIGAPYFLILLRRMK